MAEFLESIMRGLQSGEAPRRRTPIRPIEAGLPDVVAIRKRTGLSQVDFARSIGVKTPTLMNWEQKRRVPEGPARVLLAMIAKDPSVVQRLLG